MKWWELLKSFLLNIESNFFFKDNMSRSILKNPWTGLSYAGGMKRVSNRLGRKFSSRIWKTKDRVALRKAVANYDSDTTNPIIQHQSTFNKINRFGSSNYSHKYTSFYSSWPLRRIYETDYPQYFQIIEEIIQNNVELTGMMKDSYPSKYIYYSDLIRLTKYANNNEALCKFRRIIYNSFFRK